MLKSRWYWRAASRRAAGTGGRGDGGRMRKRDGSIPDNHTYSPITNREYRQYGMCTAYARTSAQALNYRTYLFQQMTAA